MQGREKLDRLGRVIKESSEVHKDWADSSGHGTGYIAGKKLLASDGTAYLVQESGAFRIDGGRNRKSKKERRREKLAVKKQKEALIK